MSAGLIDPLRAIVSEAGVLVRSLRIESVNEKEQHDYVTNVDLAVGQFLTDRLKALTPDRPVLSEEDAASWRPDDGAFWVIDPIDGTLNFLTGMPFFAVSVALLESDADAPGVFAAASQVATVLDIARDETFVAANGVGAWRDQERILPRGAPPSLICLSSGATVALATDRRAFDAVRRYGKMRNLGSQALHLCAVAAGRAAAAISEEARLWDDAAGRLIAMEAGAVYQSFAESDEGGADAPQRSLCCHASAAAGLTTAMTRVWEAPGEGDERLR